jgi:phage terminase large subunit-like protein
MPKGWGKSPLAAAIAIAELAGPVRFAGWNADGKPVGRPWGSIEDETWPWVQIAAVSEDQTENTYSALYEMLTANHDKAAVALGIDAGRSRLYLVGRPGRLEPVTASAGSREGQPITHSVLDETHLWWPTNGGVKLAETIRRNLAKMKGRSLETTNAPPLGKKSVAEQTGLAAENGEPGILFYARRPSHEPDPDWSDAQMVAALQEVYGEARWIDQNRILEEIHDPATEWSDNVRFYFNVPQSAVDHWLNAGDWQVRARKRRVPKGTEVVLAFCGNQTSTAAGLVGCTPQGHLFVVSAWESEKVSHGEVEGAVIKAMRRYQVSRLVYNAPGWEKDTEDWEELYGEEVAVQFSRRQHVKFIAACDRFYTAVMEGRLTHDGDPRVARHLANARPRDTGEGVRIIDGGEGYPVTLAYAVVLAFDQATAGEETDAPMFVSMD